MPVERKILIDLASARRDAKIHHIIDAELIKNAEEAILLTALIKTFGDSPSGFIYYSPGRARSQERPPDAVLCHPEIGILVIEAKGHTIDQIEGVEAGSIFIKYQGYLKPKNVVQQVENQMYEIKNDARKIIPKHQPLPLFNSMVAFPNIYESDWAKLGYDRSLPTYNLLFKEHFETRARLKQRISNLVQESLKNLPRNKTPINADQIQSIFKVFGNSSVINDQRQLRGFIEEETLGNYIDEMVNVDKFLSREQQDLSRMIIDDSPRLIRGVAGSGKSVVLANNVARHIHRRLNSLETPLFPSEISIAVTCFNRALVDFLKQKIRLAYREQTLTGDIPSSILTINHLNSLMYTLCKHRGWQIDYINFDDSDPISPSERAKKYREQIAKFASEQPEFYKNVCFDVIFVDEGQDFEPEEYMLLLDLIRPNEVTEEKPLVIFYDDAQNIYGRSRPVWKEIGLNLVGERSKVMRECFRNTRQIVELAFNVLLGSQAPTETKVKTRTYADINHLKTQGIIEEVGDHFRVKFADRQGGKSIIQEFENEETEINWIKLEIEKLISVEKVRHEDILILFNNPSNFNYTNLKDKILEKFPAQEFIFPFGKSSKDKDKYIFQPGKLTISTVYGAKGYDAPIVFLCGVDKFDKDIRGRATFYVGATRAKILLYLSGVQNQYSLLSEAIKVNQII